MSFSEEEKEWLTRKIREELRRILDTGLMYTAESKNAPQAKPIEQTNDILARYPPHLAAQLTAELCDGYWIIKPRQRLEMDDFKEAARLTRSMDGDYIGGKGAHFKVKA